MNDLFYEAMGLIQVVANSNHVNAELRNDCQIFLDKILIYEDIEELTKS